MTKEDKELLLKDLCARLPYEVKCQLQEDEDTYIGTLRIIEVDNKNGHLLDFTESISGLNHQVYLSEIKPYLFPLSSMTEEQKEEYNQSRLKDLRMLSSVLTERISDGNNFDRLVVAYNEIDWLNKNHFDYRGLIEKGLAIDATGLNIY